MLSHVLFLAALANATFDFSPLLNVGATGVILAWMLWQAVPRMRGIESAVDRLSDAILILLLEIDRTTPQAREQAQVIRNKIKDARKARGEAEPQ